MKTLTFAAIHWSLMFIAVTGSLFCVQPAQAGYIVTLKQVGSNVVANGSGPINLTGLTSSDRGLILTATINANIGLIITGPFASFADGFSGITGPTSFGSGGSSFPNSGSGDMVGISGFFGPPCRATQLCLRGCSIGQHDL